MHRTPTRPLLAPRSLAILLAGVLGLAAFASSPAVASTEATTPSPTTGADTTPLPADAAVLHVDGVGYDRQIWPDGSEALPYPTISMAVARAQQLRKAGQAVRILVGPGTYRETVSIGSSGANPPLVLESAEPGQAVVSGADVETRWTPVDGGPLVSAPWDQAWGLAPVPAGWDGIEVPAAVRRREAVLIDGTPLTQVLTEAELVPGTFLVDESGGRLVVHPPTAAGDLADHLVEVAKRSRVLLINGTADDVTIRGFTFEAGAAPFEKHMAYVSDATDVLIEGNTFRRSSWGGLGLCCTSGITVRDNRAVDNGGNGIDSYKATDLILAGNTITGNNVRGGTNGYTGWSVAGSKHLLLRDALLTGNTYEANRARGLWLDTDVSNVVVAGDRSCSNSRDGLFVEAVQGPLTIEDSTFCGNGRGGVVVATSGNATLQRSVLSANATGNLVFTGERIRTWTDHETGATVTMGDFENWTLTENQLASGGAAPLITSPVMTMSEWTERLEAGEISARDNDFIHPDLSRAIQIGAEHFPLADWDALTGDAVAPTTTTTTEPSKGKSGKGATSDAEPSQKPRGKR